jgi:hypothetical protein
MAGPALNAGDIVQVRIWTTLAEQAAVNTIHYVISTVPTPGPTPLDLITALDTSIAPEIKALLPIDATYNGMQGRVINTPTLYLNDVDVTSAGPGTNANPAMGRQLCGLIRLATIFARPKYRGRLYWPFPCVDEDFTGGIPSVAYVTALNGILGNMFSLTTFGGGGGTANCAMAIYHRATNDATRVVASGSFAERKWATQKRRGSFGRANVSPI